MSQIWGGNRPRSDFDTINGESGMTARVELKSNLQKLPSVVRLSVDIHQELRFTINSRLTTPENVVGRHEVTTEQFPAQRFRKEQAPRLKLFSALSGLLFSPYIRPTDCLNSGPRLQSLTTRKATSGCGVGNLASTYGSNLPVTRKAMVRGEIGESLAPKVQKALGNTLVKQGKSSAFTKGTVHNYIFLIAS